MLSIGRGSLKEVSVAQGLAEQKLADLHEGIEKGNRQKECIESNCPFAQNVFACWSIHPLLVPHRD